MTRVLASPHAIGTSLEHGDEKRETKSSIFAGTVIRTDDPELIPLPNAIQVWATASGVSGKQDSGNLNYGHSDAVSRAIKNYLCLKYKPGRPVGPRLHQIILEML